MHELAHQRAYFDRPGVDYAQGYRETVPFLMRIRAAVSPFIHGRVLDIGNGGLAQWDLGRAERIVFADLALAGLRNPYTVEDGELRALREAERSRIRLVCGDALRLPVADARFDVVALFYVAHHLSVVSRAGCLHNVGRALDEARRVLAPGGRLLLLENIPSGPIKLAQELGFGIGFRVLRRFGKPLPYFLSRRQVLARLDAADFEVQREQHIAWEPRVFQPLFPSWAPPGWLWERVLGNRLFVARRR